MKAIVVQPGNPQSLGLADIDEPTMKDVLAVETIAVGVCGTDHEIIDRGHGAPPPGSDVLVLGHEAVGRVLTAPKSAGFVPGELVVGIVRRPDPDPCECCAAGQWDMCLNGRYLERGIKELDGYAAERFALEPSFAIRISDQLGLRGVLVEPTSIVSKAWRKITQFAEVNCRAIGSVLVTGAGPIGLLAAMVGRQRGFDVHVVDRETAGPKPDLVARLGARYHTSFDDSPSTDVVMECTGAPSLVAAVMASANHNAVVCLMGVSEHDSREVDVGALNREVVLENHVIFGSVNANAADYEQATAYLLAADQPWLDDLITRPVPFDNWREAYERRNGDVKTVILFNATSHDPA